MNGGTLRDAYIKGLQAETARDCRNIMAEGADRRLASRIANRNSPATENATGTQPRDATPPGNQEILDAARQIFGQQAMLMHHYMDRSGRALLLQGRIASLNLSTRERITTLADVEFRVSSQWGGRHHRVAMPEDPAYSTILCRVRSREFCGEPILDSDRESWLARAGHRWQRGVHARSARPIPVLAA